MNDRIETKSPNAMGAGSHVFGAVCIGTKKSAKFFFFQKWSIKIIPVNKLLIVRMLSLSSVKLSRYKAPIW
jgi:hypothetical protein